MSIPITATDYDERVALDLTDYDPYYDDPEVETEEDRW